MKIFTKILYGIMAFLGVMLLLIIASAINPKISQAIGSVFPSEVHVSLPSLPKVEIKLPHFGKKTDAANADTTENTLQDDSAVEETSSSDMPAETDQGEGSSGSTSSSGDLNGTEILPVVGEQSTDIDDAQAESTEDASSPDSFTLTPAELELLKMSGVNKNLVPTYLRPSEDYVEAPDGVEVGGFVNISGTFETVDPFQADELRGTVGEGYTGQGLTFDATYYPYYHMLDDVGKALYKQIYSNALELYSPFSPAVKCSPYQLNNAFEAVYCDHPELFWVDAGFYGWATYGGEVLQAELAFLPTATDLTIARNRFNSEITKIINGAKGSDYNKEKYVHDALADCVIYDLYSDMNQSAYSAAVSGRTVCAGYARAMQYVLQQLSIPCYFCHGYAGEPHAWNIVCLDGEYYNVDVTWDDHGDEIIYDYFNKTDADFRSNHVRRDLSVYLPACQGTEYRGLEDKSYYPASILSDGTHNIADYGLTDSDMLPSLSSYNDDCRQQIIDHGTGSYTFWNAVTDKAVLDEIDTQFDSDENLPFMSNLPFNWSDYRIHVEYYALSNGGYAIQNIVKINQ